MTAKGGLSRWLVFPHPLALLTGFILAAAALTWVLPAGEYGRDVDPETGQMTVVPGTFGPVDATPVGFFDAIVAIPRGMAERADVVFLVFLIGGAFAVLEATGALRRAISWFAGRGPGVGRIALPALCVLFALAGAAQNLQEEIIALVPPLMLLTMRLGYTPLVAVAVSAGSAFVGSSFSPINPFQVLTAQRVADVPEGSGAIFRLVFMAIALGLWIWWTTSYAGRTRTDPQVAPDDGQSDAEALSIRDIAIFGIVGATFGILIWGLTVEGWGFDPMSALFFVMGCVVGLVGGLGIKRTAEAYAEGFRSMAYAALLIGFAGAILVVLQDGRIIDTIVRGLFVPLERLPLVLSAVGMSGAQSVLHVAVPSVSSQAVLTMPVLVPLSDLLGISRQVTVLAYQYGAGLCELITPTNGALMAILAASGVSFPEWLRFVLPRYLLLMILGAAALVIAIATGYR